MDKKEIKADSPLPGKNSLSDIYSFMLKSPETDTVIRFDNQGDRDKFSQRILQRLGVAVTEYSVLNIHKIGIDIPGKYVFEELLNWNNYSAYWPSHLAKVKLINGTLDEVHVFLFGREKIFAAKKLKFNGLPLHQLFILKKRHFNFTPRTSDPDNARSLLYDCGGGYPIGIFSFYVRSSIVEHGEKEMSQLFFMVAFNFYGRKKWFYTHPLNWIWEKIHNRVTCHVMNRIKHICENDFANISVS